MTKPPLETFFRSPLQKEDLETDEIEVKVIKGKRGEKGDTGESGKDGRDGIDGKNGIQGLIGEKGDKGERGFVGEKGDTGADGKDGKDGKDAEFNFSGKEIIEKVNKSRGEKIKKNRVEGMDEIESIARGNSRQLQNFISLGGNRQTKLQLNGVQVATGADTLNFVGGTLTPVGDGSTVSYTPPAGSSFSVLVPTGTVNGSNQTFVFSSAPSVIVLDNGNMMNKVSSDGTMNWTVVGTTVTLNQSPNFNIFGF